MNILITGASRGIGKGIARKIITSGDHHLFLISRNEKALENLKKELLQINPGTRVSVYPFDLTDAESVKHIRNRLSEEADRLDILINNAGAIVVKAFSEYSPGEIDIQFNVNYKAPALLISELLPLLRNSDASHVVNISSMGGFQGSVKFPGLSHYSASKAAIAALTECLATEYKGEISFNALCIGAVQTEMLAEAFPGYQAALTADQMGEYIADFALNANKYLNGKIIPVALMSP